MAYTLDKLKKYCSKILDCIKSEYINIESFTSEEFNAKLNKYCKSLNFIVDYANEGNVTIDSCQDLWNQFMQSVVLYMRYLKGYCRNTEDIDYNYFDILLNAIEAQNSLKNYFEQIFDGLMDILLSEESSLQASHDILILLTDIGEKINYKDKNTIAAKRMKYFVQLGETLLTCGDYNYQLAILQLIFSLFNKMLIKVGPQIFSNDENLQAQFSKIKTKQFLNESREFLLLVNEKYKTVFSIPFSKFGLNVLEYKEQQLGSYIDFNTRSKTITFSVYVDYVKTELTIKYSDIINVILCCFKGSKKFEINTKRLGCDQDEYTSYLEKNVNHRVKFILHNECIKYKTIFNSIFSADVLQIIGENQSTDTESLNNSSNLSEISDFLVENSSNVFSTRNKSNLCPLPVEQKISKRRSSASSVSISSIITLDSDIGLTSEDESKDVTVLNKENTRKGKKSPYPKLLEKPLDVITKTINKKRSSSTLSSVTSISTDFSFTESLCENIFKENTEKPKESLCVPKSDENLPRNKQLLSTEELLFDKPTQELCTKENYIIVNETCSKISECNLQNIEGESVVANAPFTEDFSEGNNLEREDIIEISSDEEVYDQPFGKTQMFSSRIEPKLRSNSIPDKTIQPENSMFVNMANNTNDTLSPVDLRNKIDLKKYNINFVKKDRSITDTMSAITITDDDSQKLINNNLFTEDNSNEYNKDSIIMTQKNACVADNLESNNLLSKGSKVKLFSNTESSQTAFESSYMSTFIDEEESIAVKFKKYDKIYKTKQKVVSKLSVHDNLKSSLDKLSSTSTKQETNMNKIAAINQINNKVEGNLNNSKEEKCNHSNQNVSSSNLIENNENDYFNKNKLSDSEIRILSSDNGKDSIYETTNNNINVIEEVSNQELILSQKNTSNILNKNSQHVLNEKITYFSPKSSEKDLLLKNNDNIDILENKTEISNNSESKLDKNINAVHAEIINNKYPLVILQEINHSSTNKVKQETRTSSIKKYKKRNLNKSNDIENNDLNTTSPIKKNCDPTLTKINDKNDNDSQKSMHNFVRNDSSTVSTSNFLGFKNDSTVDKFDFEKSFTKCDSTLNIDNPKQYRDNKNKSIGIKIKQNTELKLTVNLHQVESKNNKFQGSFNKRNTRQQQNLKLKETNTKNARCNIKTNAKKSTFKINEKDNLSIKLMEDSEPLHNKDVYASDKIISSQETISKEISQKSKVHYEKRQDLNKYIDPTSLPVGLACTKTSIVEPIKKYSECNKNTMLVNCQEMNDTNFKQNLKEQSNEQITHNMLIDKTGALNSKNKLSIIDSSKRALSLKRKLFNIKDESYIKLKKFQNHEDNIENVIPDIKTDDKIPVCLNINDECDNKLGPNEVDSKFLKNKKFTSKIKKFIVDENTEKKKLEINVCNENYQYNITKQNCIKNVILEENSSYNKVIDGSNIKIHGAGNENEFINKLNCETNDDISSNFTEQNLNPVKQACIYKTPESTFSQKKSQKLADFSYIEFKEGLKGKSSSPLISKYPMKNIKKPLMEINNVDFDAINSANDINNTNNPIKDNETYQPLIKKSRTSIHYENNVIKNNEIINMEIETSSVNKETNNKKKNKEKQKPKSDKMTRSNVKVKITERKRQIPSNAILADSEDENCDTLIYIDRHRRYSKTTKTNIITKLASTQNERKTRKIKASSHKRKSAKENRPSWEELKILMHDFFNQDSKGQCTDNSAVKMNYQRKISCVTNKTSKPIIENTRNSKTIDNSKKQKTKNIEINNINKQEEDLSSNQVSNIENKGRDEKQKKVIILEEIRIPPVFNNFRDDAGFKDELLNLYHSFTEFSKQFTSFITAYQLENFNKKKN